MLPRPALVYPRVQDPSLCPEWFCLQQRLQPGPVRLSTRGPVSDRILLTSCRVIASQTKLNASKGATSSQQTYLAGMESCL